MKRALGWILGFIVLASSVVSAQQGRVTIKDFTFEGNTQLSAEKLKAELQDLQGQNLTFDELKGAADRITDLYRKEGFFTVRAALPAQNISGGVVKLNIIESKLGKITIQGNERYRTEFLKWWTEPLEDMDIPDSKLVQRQILLLNEFPDLAVTTIVEASDDPSTVDLTLDVADDLPTHFSVDYNNFGGRFTGRNRIGATLDFGDLSGHGDRLTLRGLRSLASKGVTVGTLNYSVPINNEGTKVSMLASNAAYAVGRDLGILDIRGDAIVAGAFVSHPLVRTPDWNVDINGGLLYQNIEDTILGSTLSRDRLREFIFGITTDWRDDTGRNYFGARMTQDLGTGLGGMRPDDPLSSRQAGGGFHKWNLDLARIHAFNKQTYGVLRAQHQFATRVLPNAEQYGLGGIDSVRGYTQAAYLGDAGYAVSAEVRYQPLTGENLDLLSLAAFVDHGGAYLKRPAVGEINNVSLTGAGVGVRLNLPDQTYLRADIGWPIGNNAITNLVGKDPVTYVTFSKTF